VLKLRSTLALEVLIRFVPRVFAPSLPRSPSTHRSLSLASQPLRMQSVYGSVDFCHPARKHYSLGLGCVEMSVDTTRTVPTVLMVRPYLDVTRAKLQKERRFRPDMLYASLVASYPLIDRYARSMGRRKSCSSRPYGKGESTQEAGR
jgi:hypothetical protein